jgi:hypothetical protein
VMARAHSRLLIHTACSPYPHTRRGRTGWR